MRARVGGRSLPIQLRHSLTVSYIVSVISQPCLKSRSATPAAAAAAAAAAAQNLPPHLPTHPALELYTVGVDDGGTDPRKALRGQLGVRVRLEPSLQPHAITPGAHAQQPQQPQQPQQGQVTPLDGAGQLHTGPGMQQGHALPGATSVAGLGGAAGGVAAAVEGCAGPATAGATCATSAAAAAAASAVGRGHSGSLPPPAPHWI